jgi:hypothetical protein
MKSVRNLASRSISLPLSADEIVEFHAARILLLIRTCGTSGRRIDGLTKFAKLDFFVRYPRFFEEARRATQSPVVPSTDVIGTADDAVESAMVRHHYGPWDKRYYQVLAHLEARQLIRIDKVSNSYRVVLTDLGVAKATELATRPSFAGLLARMKAVKVSFGAKSGSFLKSLIYRLFDEEVGRRDLGEIIDI